MSGSQGGQLIGDIASQQRNSILTAILAALQKGVPILNIITGTFTAANFATTAPSIQTGASYTVSATDAAIIFNPSGTVTLTLPSAAANPGRMLQLKLIAAFAVNSASSNVVPLVGGAAGTAILAATAGKWALLQSDGTNWQLMAAN